MVRDGHSDTLMFTVELYLQGSLTGLFHSAAFRARGCFTTRRRRLSRSLSDGKSACALQHDSDTRRTPPTDYGSPCIMHMGDYLMTMNSVSDMIPSSVYQAFPPHLLGRAFYVQRTLSGLGAVRSPSFLCHPLVTPSSIRALSASGGFLLALRPQSFQLAYSQHPGAHHMGCTKTC